MNFPPEVRTVLNALIPDYRLSRETWPLWTYNRRSPIEEISDSTRSDEWTWRGSSSWPERLRWSQQLPVLAVLLELVRAFGGVEEIELFGFSPCQPSLTIWRSGARLGDMAVALPLRYQARIAAIFAVTAYPDVPSTINQLVCPSNWRGQCFLDDTDVAHLANSFRGALLGRGGEEADKLLLQFLHLDVDPGATAQAKRRSESEREKSMGDRSKLAVELCERAGLLRMGGKKRSLTLEAHAQLQTEAEGVVSAVRSRTPDAALREPLEALLSADAVDYGPSLLEIERARRDGLDVEALIGSRMRREALLLQFPFLTPAEIDEILKPKLSPRKAAHSLLIGRMAADRTEKTLMNILSAARSAAAENDG